MDAVIFAFVVIPAWICLIGAVFSLVFGSDILRWYFNKVTAQRAARKIFVPVPAQERHEYSEPAPRNRERETVSV